MSFGLLNIPAIQLTLVGTIPAPFSTVMFTGDWRGIIWWAVLLVVDLLIWYPFFKAYERITLEKEREEAAQGELEGAPDALTAAATEQAIASDAASEDVREAMTTPASSPQPGLA